MEKDQKKLLARMYRSGGSAAAVSTLFSLNPGASDRSSRTDFANDKTVRPATPEKKTR